MPETDPARRPPLALTFLAGGMMGAADAVPGVSGGTIALVVGIYERFIEAVSVVLRAPWLLADAAGRRRLAGAVAWLLPLVAGLGLAWFLATRLLVGPSDAPGWLRRDATAPACYAFFFGLVLVSLREPWRRIESPGTEALLLAVLGASAAASLAVLPHASGAPPAWALLYGGAGAISVMLLPGISGSLFLVVVGQYTTVAGAVHDRRLDLLAIFLAGVALGLALFVPLLRRLLRDHHDRAMALLTGLMAGSLVALWPWKTGYDPQAGPMRLAGVGGGLLGVLLAAAAGGLAAWGLTRLERRLGDDPAGGRSDAT